MPATLTNNEFERRFNALPKRVQTTMLKIVVVAGAKQVVKEGIQSPSNFWLLINLILDCLEHRWIHKSHETRMLDLIGDLIVNGSCAAGEELLDAAQQLSRMRVRIHPKYIQALFAPTLF